ncbi:MAG: hypothetical protein J0L56_04815 [Chitinophagales bacterium]|nr:hypothetical protein [Chitinophagales bacterium]
MQTHNNSGVKSVPVLRFAWLIFSQAIDKFSFAIERLFLLHGIEVQTEEIKEIVLTDNRRFYYTVKQVEITNILGAAVAVLGEYSITNSTGEVYKLYKTNEGNWYDVPDMNKGVNTSVLLALKFGIDKD